MKEYGDELFIYAMAMQEEDDGEETEDGKEEEQEDEEQDKDLYKEIMKKLENTINE
jgi:hypothetical protein